MSLIKKPEQIENKTILKGMIYGVPGGGKTTLALSAPKVLLIDTDNGVTRVEKRLWPDTVQVKGYADVLGVLKEDLSAYDTLVIDTAGKLVDYMADYAMAQNPAYRQNDGSLTQKGWGAIKAMFKDLFRNMEKMGKNLIFVAHEKEERDGETRILRPDIAGSAKNDLIKELDFMGYLDIVNDKRTLHLSPTAKFYAKNSIGIDECLSLWSTKEKSNTFLTEIVFGQVEKAKAEEAVKKQQYDRLLDDMQQVIETNPINTALETIQKAKHIWDSKLVCWKRLTEKATAKGLEYDKNTKKFVAKKVEKKEEKEVKDEQVSTDSNAV